MNVGSTVETEKFLLKKKSVKCGLWTRQTKPNFLYCTLKDIWVYIYLCSICPTCHDTVLCTYSTSLLSSFCSLVYTDTGEVDKGQSAEKRPLKYRYTVCVVKRWRSWTHWRQVSTDWVADIVMKRTSSLLQPGEIEAKTKQRHAAQSVLSLNQLCWKNVCWTEL